MISEPKAIREAYKPFYGRVYDVMPKLIADGRVPMNFSQLRQIQLGIRNWNDWLTYLGHDLIISDTIAYHPSNRFKIILDFQHLREMIPNAPTNKFGSLLLSEDTYKALEGEEFKKSELMKLNQHLTQREAKDHPILKTLARDQALLNDSVDYIFAEAREKYGHNTAMGVFIKPSPFTRGNTPEMEVLCVKELSIDYRSDVMGWNIHCDNNPIYNITGHLIGIAPEALEALSASSKMLQSI